MTTDAEKLLYECIRELQYVQDAKEACTSDLCASSLGAALIERGMKLLGIKQLAAETLDRELRHEAAIDDKR